MFVGEACCQWGSLLWPCATPVVSACSILYRDSPPPHQTLCFACAGACAAVAAGDDKDAPAAAAAPASSSGAVTGQAGPQRASLLQQLGAGLKAGWDGV